MSASSLNLTSTVQRDKDIVSSTINDEVVMLSIEQGKYFGLDSIGSNIWELIEEPITISDLVDRLLDRFKVDRRICEKDVLDLLSDMMENKIAKVVE